jgi:hypothetical protein
LKTFDQPADKLNTIVVGKPMTPGVTIHHQYYQHRAATTDTYGARPRIRTKRTSVNTHHRNSECHNNNGEMNSDLFERSQTTSKIQDIYVPQVPTILGERMEIVMKNR